MMLAVYHPDNVHLRRLAVGFLNPSEGQWPFLINMAMGDAGGYKTDPMWGPAETDPAWKRNDPMVQIPALVAAQHPPLGVLRQRHAQRAGWRDLPATFLEGLTIRTNETFRDNYIAAGGHNAVFNFPPNGTHDWAYWGAQLQQMKPDLISYLG